MSNGNRRCFVFVADDTNWNVENIVITRSRGQVRPYHNQQLCTHNSEYYILVGIGKQREGRVAKQKGEHAHAFLCRRLGKPALFESATTLAEHNADFNNDGGIPVHIELCSYRRFLIHFTRSIMLAVGENTEKNYFLEPFDSKDYNPNEDDRI